LAVAAKDRALPTTDFVTAHATADGGKMSRDCGFKSVQYMLKGRARSRGTLEHMSAMKDC